MTDEPIPDSVGKTSGSDGEKVGYKNPPKHTRFGQPGATTKRGKKPKDFQQLRDLAVRISHEIITNKETGQQFTVAELILRDMAKENPARFVEIAFGKVPDEVKVSGSLTVKKAYVTISPDDWDQADSDVQPAPVAGNTVAGQVASAVTDG